MAYTVNYLRPVFGTTPPTATQAANVNTVVASIFPNNSADGQLAITHNLNIPAGDLSQGFPTITFRTVDSVGTGSGYYQASQNANFVVINRTGTTAGVDSQPQSQVYISRPHTIAQ